MKTLLLLFIVVSASLCALAQATQSRSTPDKGDPLITCRLTRQSDGMFVGNCLQERDKIFELRLAAPAANEANLWRGTARAEDGAISPVAIDQSGVIRHWRYWVELTGIQIKPDLFQFSFDRTTTITPTKDDLEILRRARSYLDDAAHWNHGSDPDVTAAVPAFAGNPDLSRRGFCPATGPRTLFCALYHASIEQTGEYWWGRPAVNAVRAAVDAEAPTKLQHPLMQFNGAPETKLADVQRVLDVAMAYLKERQMCNVQYWVWGAARSNNCK